MDDYKQLGPGELNSSQKFPFLVSLLQSHGKFINDLIHEPLRGETNLFAPNFSKLLSRPVREIDEYYKSLDDDLRISPTDINELLGGGEEGGGEEGGGGGEEGGGGGGGGGEEAEGESFISTGLPDIDEALGGSGIPLGEITEIFGASGCGKSQFVYQIIHNCTLKYPESKPVHIATEAFMESKRLQDIFSSDDSVPVKQKLDQVSYIYCPDLESQDHILFTQLPILLDRNQGCTKLLVIDSIAQHFRREDAMSNATFLTKKLESQLEALRDDQEFSTTILPKQRTQLKMVVHKSQKYATRSTKVQYLCQLYRHLTRLARKYGIAVVVINQVSAHTMDYDDNKLLDQVLFDDLLYPLNLDFQTLIASGWDAKVISKYLPPTSVRLNERDLELLETEFLNSSDTLNNRSYKRQRGEGNEIVEKDPRFNKVRQSDLLETQKELIMKAHELRNKNTKKAVPTMGYPWSIRIQNKIMLMKTYKPILKSKSELMDQDAEVSVDLESGLTFASLCQGFHVNGKRNHSSAESSEDASRTSTTDDGEPAPSLLKGWQVERFIKVVSSSHNMSNGNRNRCSFEINKQGLKQI
ncbi:RAD57 [Candida oxycetoniae]|uniref:RAD57 n=1 Tax=Candida oxycetoniae TaxID=497107 RepID=A0AAI9WZ64_9ASCO|nr:RAD57 [Candida oxycetoniae]KAI3406086.2 RAD57 [Candida oxycetoniae]